MSKYSDELEQTFKNVGKVKETTHSKLAGDKAFKEWLKSYGHKAQIEQLKKMGLL